MALAQMFQTRNSGCEVLFVGADGGMETRLVPKEGYPIETVTITNFRRSLSPASIGHNVENPAEHEQVQEAGQRHPGPLSA
ncbi:MAG: hypothetical protein ACLT3D_03260 [Lawsonibacter sp.]